MIDQAAAIALACAEHLKVSPMAAVQDESNESHFHALLKSLDEAELPSSTFTDLSLAILFSMAKGFSPDLLVSFGAFHGIGARAMAAGVLANSTAPDLTEILCEIDDRCLEGLARHHNACLNVLPAWTRDRAARGYTTIVTQTPAPEVIDELPAASRYVALIDLDCPKTGKAAYATTARKLIEDQPGSGILIFHDVCVNKFANDVRALEEELEYLGAPFMALPIDDCGLGIAYAR